mgnify:CR=1 FL=1
MKNLLEFSIFHPQQSRVYQVLVFLSLFSSIIAAPPLFEISLDPERPYAIMKSRKTVENG